MTRLEDLTTNAAVRGILPDCLVTVVSVQWFGSEALDKPSEIINAANEFANGGFDWIVEGVTGAPNKTLAVYNRIEELFVESAVSSDGA